MEPILAFTRPWFQGTRRLKNDINLAAVYLRNEFGCVILQHDQSVRIGDRFPGIGIACRQILVQIRAGQGDNQRTIGTRFLPGGDGWPAATGVQRDHRDRVVATGTGYRGLRRLYNDAVVRR